MMVSSNQYYLRKALSDLVPIEKHFTNYRLPTTIRLIRLAKGGDIQGFLGEWKRNFKVEKDARKLEKLYDPDLFLFQGFHDPQWKNIHKVSCPKAVFWGDPHYKPQIRWVNKNKIDLSLHGLKVSMPFFRKVLFKGHKMGWIPFAIDSEVFKDYRLKRFYDVALLGIVTKQVYPLRMKIQEALLDRNDLKIFHKVRPPEWTNDPKKTLMRENYAKVLSMSKIFIFDNSIFKYPLQKYFEAMACKTLALAPIPLDAEALHFKAGYNFVEINEKNFLAKVFYYVEHEEERKKIALNGYSTVRKYHTCDIRARQLLKHLENLMNGVVTERV